MKIDIAKLWVEALRSGEYQQTREVLYRVEGDEQTSIGFCCLGVLCDIHRKETGEGTWAPSKIKEWFQYQNKQGQYSVCNMPEFVRVWAGMMSTQGTISDDHCLTGDNDAGRTFEEIARTIEENVGVL